MVEFLTRAPAVAVSETTYNPARNLKSQVFVIRDGCRKSSQAPPVVDSMHYVKENEA